MGEDADHAHPDTSSAAVQKVYQMLGTHMASGILTLRPLHLPLPRTDQRLAESIYSDPPTFWAWTGWLRHYRPAEVGGGQAVEQRSGRDTDPAHSSVMSAGAGREGVGCFSGDLEPSKTKHSAVPAGAMERLSCVLLWKLVLLQSPAVLLYSGPSGTAAASSSVVSESVVSWAAGTQAVLRCQSPRMVWTQDRLHDRQRVVHWDLSGVPGSQGRRLVDMYSAGEQRVYESRDHGRLLLSPSAFHDGNFSLLIRAVEEGDEGVYTCNLHHHYCHLYESLAVRLEVTDDPLLARAYWDGEKEVMVVTRGAPALLTCVNRAHLWTDRHLEEAQQVVHWDRQLPGVSHDRADRLLDLYASGERRAYGPSFLRDRVAVNADAFARGDFSLRIDALEPADEGIYSCHLHHHYCGLHERRVFHLQVTEAAFEPPAPASPGNGSGHNTAPSPDPTLVSRSRGHSVINVIVPESHAHFFQQLGYVLATLLLFILLLITVVLATRHRHRGGCETSDKNAGKSKGKDVNMMEFAAATRDQAPYRTEDIQLDYKNNILKERAELAHSPLPAKNVDLDKEFRKEYCK